MSVSVWKKGQEQHVKATESTIGTIIRLAVIVIDDGNRNMGYFTL